MVVVSVGVGVVGKPVGNVGVGVGDVLPPGVRQPNPNGRLHVDVGVGVGFVFGFFLAGTLPTWFHFSPVKIGLRNC